MVAFNTKELNIAESSTYAKEDHQKEGGNMSFLKGNLAITRLIEFQNPQKMVFGVGAAEKVGEEAKRLGGGRVFVCSKCQV